MTALVGILCTDGVVIGSDSAVTTYIESPSEKIKMINDSAIIASAGAIGLGQRFYQTVRKYWEAEEYKDNYVDVAKHLSRIGLEDFLYTGITFDKGIGYGALVAYTFDGDHHLCSFDSVQFQPTMFEGKLWSCTMGSTQYMTDPFLGHLKSIFWPNEQPSVADGVFAVKWTLHHAIQLNTGTVNGPIHIAVLEKDEEGKYKTRMLSEPELLQHCENINAMKNYIRGYQEKFKSTITKDVPKP